MTLHIKHCHVQIIGLELQLTSRVKNWFFCNSCSNTIVSLNNAYQRYLEEIPAKREIPISPNRRFSTREPPHFQLRSHQNFENRFSSKNLLIKTKKSTLGGWAENSIKILRTASICSQFEAKNIELLRKFPKHSWNFCIFRKELSPIELHFRKIIHKMH